MEKNLKTVAVIFFLAIWFFAISTYGADIGFKDISELDKDLSVTDATLIVQQNAPPLINKGSEQGIHKGDLWLIYKSHATIQEPQTGRTLQPTDSPIALAKVVDLEKDFAKLHIQCFSPNCRIRNGFIAKRFKQIPSYFYDMDGSYRPLYEWLRSNVPNLDWTWYQQIVEESEARPEEDSVVMVAHNDRLTIWSGNEIIGVYKVPSNLKEKIDPYAAQSSLSNASLKKPDYRIDTFDQIAVSIDMALTDEGPFLVYLASQTIYAKALNNSKVYTYPYKGFGQPINISIGKNGLIALNIYDKAQGMQSRILKLRKGGFLTILKDINYIFGFFDTDFDSTAETLLAQNFDEESFWGIGVYKFDLVNGKLVNKQKVAVPDDFEMFGAFYSDLNGNHKPEIGYYNRKGRLCLVEDGKQIWESSIRMDGSVQVVQFDNPEDPELPVPDNKKVWPSSAVINGEERQAVAVPVNISDMWGAVGGAPEEGDVRMLYYTKVRFLFPSLPYNFAGPVQSVFVYDNKLYCAVVDGDVFQKKGKTYLYAYPLDEVMAHVI